MVSHNKYRQKKHFKNLVKRTAAKQKAAATQLRAGDHIIHPVKIHTELYRQPAEGYRQYIYGMSNPKLRPIVPEGK